MRYGTREERRNAKWREQQQQKVRKQRRSSEGARRMGNPFEELATSATFELTGSPQQSLTDTLKERAAKREEAKIKAQASLDRLMALPGMGHIRTQIEQVIALKRINDSRRKQGLKTEEHTLHMAFLGNPGTGKTTAARLIGEAFIHLGLLKSYHHTPPFVEVIHSDIESPYVGVAEQKIKEKFEKARGGVVFIDEAYSFAGPHHHNKTTLATLVSCIEDMRDEVLVVVAGYPDEMETFFDANPGLRSRFNTFVDFPDYDMKSLLQIADLMATERDYVISADYRAQLVKRLEEEKALPSFGNARTIRNIIEESIRMHSLRLIDEENPSREQLQTLTATDIKPNARQIKRNPGSRTQSATIVVTEIESRKGKYRAGEDD